MRPVDSKWRITQGFAAGATQGVAANANPSSGVGYLVHLYGNYQQNGHAGVDIGAPAGTPVRAARSGMVVWAGWDIHLPGGDWWGPGGYFDRWGFYKSFGGRLVVVRHASGELDVVAHLSAFKVTKGQFVTEGQLIGLSGDSSGGRDGVLGPHVHCERIVDTTNYSTGGGKIFGRTNPTAVWGTGSTIAPQGDITEEEFEVITDADVTRIAKVVVATLMTDVRGGNTLGELISEERSHHEDVLKTVNRVPNAVLNTSIPRGGDMGGETTLAAVTSWHDAHVIAIVDAVSRVTGGDVGEIRKAVIEGLKDGIKVDVTVLGGGK